MGGISRTVTYKGNRIDIGGHRFFSKSDRVMQWWQHIMDANADATRTDRAMLVRNRKSRIYFLRSFFDYPVKLSAATLRNLGAWRSVRIGMSYAKSTLWRIKPERSLEDFMVNRFGRQLYLTFFKSYTEKVWGWPCDKISAEWGAQRIKGLSIAKALLHMARSCFGGSRGIAQKDVETSLIERFLYPKLGPGQLWEYVAADVTARGGEILTGWQVTRVLTEAGRVTGVIAVNEGGEERRFDADYVISTMPVKDLVAALGSGVPANVREVASGLLYRDFITTGLLVDRLEVSEPDGAALRDNWIYIQEPEVLVGRMQIFNNWSPYLVSDPSKVWIGLEYFCNEGDELWRLTDAKMIELASREMESIGIIKASAVRDATVIRVPKTYPAYFGAYERFSEVREYLDGMSNLFLVGRNGMHKYNNQDHSMLTAMTAVENIVEGRLDKANLWAVNTEQEYHESKSA
jgi:protoporphyrinogen oxidase